MDAFPTSSDLLGKSASAYEHLRRAVSRGQLRPGRRLSATGLASAFRISETPVREALVRMAAEGFLAWEASKGHFTKPVTLEEQEELHDVVAISLNGCLQHAAVAEPPLLARLAEAPPQAMTEPADTADADDHTAQLLGDLGAALVDRSGNGVLRVIMSIMSDRTYLIRRLDLDTPDRIVQVRHRIGGVVSAVRADDRGTAMGILGQHLAERRRRLPDLVAAANLVAAAATYP
jgi:DNA-binding GntR family transcriptional regulator